MGLLSLLMGCAVSQWEREHLSDPIMQGDSPDVQMMKQHILKNREGSPGGTGSASSGCGC